MATPGEGRKLSVSIYDYPDHLNPFHEENNHRRLQFWTLSRKPTRSSSFSLAGLKDFRNTWSFKSFTKKGRREQKANSQTLYDGAPSSPIVYRKTLNDQTNATPVSSRNTTGNQSPPNRYVYGGSVTPLPRFRFQERGTLADVKSPEVNMSSPRRISTPTGSSPAPLRGSNEPKLEFSGSRTSLQSNNPFDDSINTSVRASSRKKRRAPPPPPRISSVSATPNITVTDTSENTTTVMSASIPNGDAHISLEKEDIDIDHPSLNIELKIVEDEDSPKKEDTIQTNEPITTKTDVETVTVEITNTKDSNKCNETEGISVESRLEDSKISEPISDDSFENIKLPEIPEKKIEDDENMVDDVFKLDIEDEKVEDTLNDINFVIEKIKLDDPPTSDMFPKVDIITYKKQQSLEINQLNNNEEEPTVLSNLQSEAIIETKIIKPNEEKHVTISDALPAIDTVNSDSNSSSSPQIVKCKLINGNENKYTSTNSERRREFFKFEEIRDSSPQTKNSDESNEYRRKRVSDMRLLFDNPKVTETKSINDTSLSSPNPLPKPRRSRLGSKTPSSESFKGDLSPVNDNSTIKL